VAEAIAPPDGEAVAVAWLKARFAARSESATVATKVPSTRPARMVRVSLAGTPEQTPLHFYTTLLFECWAPTETAASDLARTAYALMRASEDEDVNGVHVAEVVTVGGVVNFPDEVGPRYQFTLDLLLAGEAL
jgi:hypothetical protein